MTRSRRTFLKSTVGTPLLSTLGINVLGPILRGATVGDYRPQLMPSQKQVWDWQTWMAKLGPKYTGNKAHTEFVNFLGAHLEQLGLDVKRRTYKFPRWDAQRWAITISPGGDAAFEAPVTSYFPYSGETPAEGVTGPLVYAGHSPSFDLSGVAGKIVLIDFATNTRKFGEIYRPWGIYPAEAHFPSAVRPARGAVNDLAQFKKAGALGVILAWTDVSDANAQDQYTPFSRPHQGIPGLYVGRETGAKLKSLAGQNVKATVILEAATYPDTPTDTLIATLPGTSADENIILNTHTDGTNATEENGALGILALATYFSKLPKTERKRTLVLPLTTGHFAGPWVPSIRGVIEENADMIRKSVAAITVEHLGCLEWLDDASFRYRATGENEWAVAITESPTPAKSLVEALQGSGDQKTAVVDPVHGGWLGEGSALAKAGVPTIGYIPQPNYLLAAPANGCIEKLSAQRMYSEIEVFAKAVHRMDGMNAAELKQKASG